MVDAFWYQSNNFGDNINYYLIKKLTGKEPRLIYGERNIPHLIVCGSILSEANEYSTIVGAGFANETDYMNEEAKVISVRGNLTKEKIGLDCLVGDPALLLTKFVNPKVEKKHKLGLIPHWMDIHNAKEVDAYLINPLKPFNEIIEDVVSCEKIISSGLHGLIIADAYNIPNKWISFGTDIGGDGFKFMDYYSTTDRPKECNNRDFFVSNYIHNLDEYLKVWETLS